MSKIDEVSKNEISKKWIPEAGQVMESIAVAFEGLASFDEGNTAALAKEIIQKSGVKMGNVMPVFRAALTGSTQGPDVYAIAAILGKEKTVSRLRAFLARSAKQVNV